MSKNDKIYSASVSIISGIVLIISGIITYIYNVNLYNTAVFITLIFVLIDCIKKILLSILKKRKKGNPLLIIVNLIFCNVLLSVPKIPQSFFPLIFSIYQLIHCFINFTSFIIYYNNKVHNKYIYLFRAIYYLIIGGLVLLFPLKHLALLLKILSIYFIVLGSLFITQSIYHLIPSKYKNLYKKRIKISLPVWLEVIIPYTVFVEINNALKVKNNIKIPNNNDESILEVLVHVSPNGFNRVGHVDLVYGDKVISYGNYDDSSKKLKKMIGDGVLFYTDKKTYIPFCINQSKKMLFGFELNINEEQKKLIDKKLKEIKELLEEWNPRIENIGYAKDLAQASNTKFYKFTNGKFKTYYVFGSSCCDLANEIIGSSGIDFLKMNGLICPGTYYDCLNREYINKTGLVLKKNIYATEPIE